MNPFRRSLVAVRFACPFVLVLVFTSTVQAQARVEPVSPVDPGGREASRAEARLGATADLTFNREVRLGPFILRPGAAAGVGARAVARNGGSSSLVLGSELFADVGPSLGVLLPVGARHMLSVTGVARYRWTTSSSTGESADEGSQNRWLYSGVAGYGFQGGSVDAALTYSASRSEEGYLAYLADGDGVEQTETLGLRDVTRYGPGARLGFEITSRTRFEIQADRKRLEHVEVTAGTEAIPGLGPASELDRDRSTVDVVLERQMTSRTAVGLFGNASVEEYLKDPSRDNTRFTVGLQGRSDGGGAGGSLSGLIRLGVQKRSLNDKTRESFTGPFAQGAVGWRVDRNLMLNFLARARTEATTWADNVYYLDTEGGLVVDLALVRDFGIYGGARYGRLRYPEPAALEQPDGSILTAKRTDKRWVFEGGFLFTLFGSPVRLGGGYFERTSNFAFVSNTGWFFRLSLNGSVGVRRAV